MQMCNNSSSVYDEQTCKVALKNSFGLDKELIKLTIVNITIKCF